MCFLLAADAVLAQVSSSGRLTGTVTDPTGAVVVDARVQVRDEVMGSAIELRTGSSGQFTVASLRAGSYTVTVTAAGFSRAEYRGVEIVAGGTNGLDVRLSIGRVDTTIVVQAGAEVLETQSTTVTSRISGRPITQLPLVTRNAVELTLLLPGVQTTGRPQDSTVLGLPIGAINITYDGINAQDNFYKISDGFAAEIVPNIDAIGEFSISSAAQGAEQSGEGAVQIRFETQRGTNEYHGGLWWYHRNDALNANYYFNNLAGLPKDRMRLNQFGYKLGGPILKGKLYFFHAFDFYRFPRSNTRTQTILTDDASQGRYTYAVSTVPSVLPPWVTCDAVAKRCTADLMAMAGNFGFQSSLDPAVETLMTAMNSAATAPGVRGLPGTSLFTRKITFQNQLLSARYMPDLRLDWDVTKNHQLTVTYHYQKDIDRPTIYGDPLLPVPPYNTSFVSLFSDRNLVSTAWRWNLTSKLSNELRFGIQSRPNRDGSEINLSLYPEMNTNLGPTRAWPFFDFISQPLLDPSGRGWAHNAPLGQLIETLSWMRGKHFLSFGANFTQTHAKWRHHSEDIPYLHLGVDYEDPAYWIFTSENLPGATWGNQDTARTLYGNLTGRIIEYFSKVYVNPRTKQFENGVGWFERTRQREFGLYATDSWRLRPGLTINAGLRWEYQGVPNSPDNMYYRLKGGYAGLFGVSGLNNLFKPGTLTGSVTVLEPNGDDPLYDGSLNNFAPSVGVAWTPNFSNALWRAVFGGQGKTVLRGGYGVSYTREGLQLFQVWSPQHEAQVFAWPVSPSGPIGPGEFPAGSATLSGGITGLRRVPEEYGASIIADPAANLSVGAYAPNLRTPAVHSWQVGIQREITPDTAVEVRYVGNRGTNLLRQSDLNEVNIFENGFLAEFNNARSNLAICRADPGCAAAESFANLGLPGQMELPIFNALFTGSTAPAPGDPNFGDWLWIAFLDEGSVGYLASNMMPPWNQTAFENLQAAGYPINFWVVNPHVWQASRFYNGGRSSYDGLQVEVRRRMSGGLQFNANYTFSKSESTYFAGSWVRANAYFMDSYSLRSPGRDMVPSAFDLRHQFKAYGTWSLPFGAGRKWSPGNPFINKVVEGWGVSALVRWQSGRIFQMTGGTGTVNQYDSGVELIGITPEQIQDQLSVRKLPNGLVYYWPEGLMDASGRGPNLDFIRPCSTPGKFCQLLFLRGPAFFRANISVSKRTRITEGVDIEYRAEFLNAFNNTTFYFGGGPETTVNTMRNYSRTFGQITKAYRDLLYTDDPGARIIQMVLRINF